MRSEFHSTFSGTFDGLVDDEWKNKCWEKIKGKFCEYERDTFWGFATGDMVVTSEVVSYFELKSLFIELQNLRLFSESDFTDYVELSFSDELKSSI